MKPRSILMVEWAALVSCNLFFLVAQLLGLSIAEHPIWLFLVSSALFYQGIRLITKGTIEEQKFIFLIPLAVATLWQFFAINNLNLQPLIYLIVTVLFFALSLRDAIFSALLMLFYYGVASISVAPDIPSIVWLLLITMVWSLLFWFQKNEKESIRLRYENMQSRAKGFISPVQKQLTDMLPELDSETQLAKAAASAFRLENLMKWMTDLIHEVMHPYSCFFFFLDQNEANLKILAYKSKSRFFDPDTVVEVNSNDILAWVVLHKQKIRHERLPKELQQPEYYNKRERILSCMFYPVVINDRVEGLLGIDARRSYSFGVDEDHLMQLFANLTGDLITAFRAYQEKEYHADYMEAFYRAVKQIIQTKLDLKTRLGLLIKISDMIKKSEEIAVAIPKHNGTVVVRQARGDTLKKLEGAIIHEDSKCHQLLHSGVEVTIEDIEELYSESKFLFVPGEPRLRVNSLLFVVLPVLQNMNGFLILGSRKRDYYTHNDRFVFSTLAAQFGIAIENAINISKIQELAITDGLTSLYNHRYFQDFLANEVKLVKRQQTTCSLIILDIDHFKSFNDTYGHQAGDEVLKHLARLLLEHAREVDIVARYGGEEFVIILRQCELKMAGKIAERLRKSCEKSKIKYNDEILNVTISIGVANCPDHADNPPDLISIADSCLYKAKESGRNRVVVAGP